MKKLTHFLALTLLLSLSLFVTGCFVTSGSSSSGYPDSSSFSRNYSWEGIDFNITASNGQLTIQPRGLQSSSYDNTVRRRINGEAYNAEVGDLDRDGSPEVFVYTSSGQNKYGEVIAYSVLNRNSMNEIYMPDIRNDANLSQGYEGYDEFGLVDGFLIRTFPLFNYGNRTGEVREIRYRMVYGENSKVFRIESVRDFYSG